MPEETESRPEVSVFEVKLPAVDIRTHPRFEKRLEVSVRQAPLLNAPPWVRSPGRLAMEVTTQGWRFPTPPEQLSGKRETIPPPPRAAVGRCPLLSGADTTPAPAFISDQHTRPRPPLEKIQFKDRLLYLLQPPLETLFGGGGGDDRVSLPFQPYPY